MNNTTMNSTNTKNPKVAYHEDHDQASLISALSGEETDTSLLAGEEVVVPSSLNNNHYDDDEEAGCTLISNTSSTASNYFLPPHHKHADSLCYSATSSACDPPPSDREKGVPTSSYLASFGNSLGSQQAFPCSMFPGQKLLPPNNSKHPLPHEGDEDDSRRPHSYLPSYYFMTPSSSEPPSNRVPSSWQESYQNSRSGGMVLQVDDRSTIARYNSAPFVGSNVYQKRAKRSSEFYDDDVSLPANWMGAIRCLFSPRVLVTLLICAVILLNLLRVGTHSKHHRNHDNSASSTLRGGHVNADYVKLETIGRTGSWAGFDDVLLSPTNEEAFQPEASFEQGKDEP
eukprot:jgi/Psemu1/287396/fgenesh1_pg.189_\